jgi:hypothetical protein
VSLPQITSKIWMYYSLLICLLEVFLWRKVASCLKAKEKVMGKQTKHRVSLEKVLSVYSGRRLQYAIKLGILPTPEILKQLLKVKTNTRKGMINTGMVY